MPRNCTYNLRRHKEAQKSRGQGGNGGTRGQPPWAFRGCPLVPLPPLPPLPPCPLFAQFQRNSNASTHTQADFAAELLLPVVSTTIVWFPGDNPSTLNSTVFDSVEAE